MIHVAVAAALLAAGIVSWYALKSFALGYGRYRQAFQKQAVDRLSEFFLFLDPAQLWVANLLACASVAALGLAFSGRLWLAGLCGGLALAVPQWGIRHLKRRRAASFEAQLPDLLMALAGALRAGSGMQSALQQIVAHAPAPLAQEFGLLLREQRMGISFEEALANLYRRMPTEGAGLAVSALTVAAHSGGSLAETLERISATLRARLQLLARVAALTSQGRLQAWVMAMLPIALAAVLNHLDPDSMRVLWEQPIGWSVLAAVAVLELTGILFIRRIVAIKV
ncbi:type II secretion system F family protein [Parapusillimonas granuli]|uniref:Type II secretion system F family protein n=1 Tax=Parapusillimonas granuli TaxID=380911 RepID=A0A853G449_9BURK|nr:type II secretion system F family protein [Parapusillimonas granuli]MBB5214387.1 tight adherence protein B [Parapusillimonas granuli]MEB2399199.1 type II secretion system F family protein [Alcaligenaceae bacterium]NYT51079.1 type II secretion system F family protein [Parapusillimonas granuli]